MKILTFVASFIVALPLGIAGQGGTSSTCNPVGSVEFVCGQQAPEDLVVIPGGEWVIASSFGGNGGIELISTRDKTTTTAYPTATSKDRLDAKTYDSCPGGKWLYVAAWGSQSFFRMSLGQTPVKRDNISLGFRVDNIRWAVDGSILAAGQGGVAPMQTSNVVTINPNTQSAGNYSTSQYPRVWFRHSSS